MARQQPSSRPNIVFNAINLHLLHWICSLLGSECDQSSGFYGVADHLWVGCAFVVVSIWPCVWELSEETKKRRSSRRRVDMPAIMLRRSTQSSTIAGTQQWAAMCYYTMKHERTLDRGTTLIHCRRRGDNGRVAHKQRSQCMKCAEISFSKWISPMCANEHWTRTRKKKKIWTFFFFKFTHNDLSLSRQRQFRLPLSECRVCVFLVLDSLGRNTKILLYPLFWSFCLSVCDCGEFKSNFNLTAVRRCTILLFSSLFFLFIFHIFVSDGMSHFDTPLGGGSTSEWRISRWILNVEFSVHMLSELSPGHRCTNVCKWHLHESYSVLGS